MDLLVHRRMMMTPATPPPPVPIQIVKPSGTLARQTSVSGATYSRDTSTGIVTVTITKTVTAATSYLRWTVFRDSQYDHIFYVKANGSSSYIGVRTSSMGDIYTDKVDTQTSSGGANLFIRLKKNIPPGTYTVRPIVIDLTATFGEGNEPDLATCRRYYPNDYYDYTG